jgi:hypothetical protein
MNNLELARAILEESPYCATCGSDLVWHLKQKGNRHIYLMPSNELLCGRKCYEEYIQESYHIFNKQVLEGK